VVEEAALVRARAALVLARAAGAGVKKSQLSWLHLRF
jgi:hypothetical protein